MASNIGSMNNVKIFVLYLMKNINYPMDYITINEVVMQTDYIMFLDFDEAFHQMLDGGLIEVNGTGEDGAPLYSVTHKGSLVAEQLKCDILPVILDQSLTCALRYLDFRQRGVTLDCIAERRGDQTFDVTVTLKEKNKVLMTTTINADSEYHATQMKRHFMEHPDVVYRGVLALLTGKVSFLYDDRKEPF